MSDTVRRLSSTRGTHRGFEFTASDLAVEEIDAADVKRGDRLLLAPGDRVPTDAVLVSIENHSEAVVRSPETSPASESPGEPEDDAEPDHERRDTPVTPGERLAGETLITTGTVVVRIGPVGVLGWLPAATSAFSLARLGSLSLKHVFLLTIVILSSFSAAGLGAMNPVTDALAGSQTVQDVLDSLASDSGSAAASNPFGATEAETPSAPPDPAVTPPPESEELETATPTVTAVPTGTPSSTESSVDPTETAAANGSATPTDRPNRPSNGGGGGGGSTSDVSVTLTVNGTDPPTVTSPDGGITSLSGTVSGTLSWTGTVDSVVLVVQTWVPGSGWAEVERRTMTGGDAGRLSLARTLGSVVYVNGSRATAFANTDDGTTDREEGRVSVTAVLFRNGEEVARTQQDDRFVVTVTNEGNDLDLDLSNGASEAETFLSIDQVAPGASGSRSATLTNRGGSAGRLRLANLSYVSLENGQTEPEAEVDPTGGDPGVGNGELQSAMQISVYLRYGDGTRQYVVGNATTSVHLANVSSGPIDLGALAAGEAVEFVVDYRVPADVGNEIQSDELSVDFTFALVQADEA